MNPIINPIWFYICSIVDGIKDLAAGISIVSILFLYIILVFGPVIDCLNKKNIISLLKIGILIACVSFLIHVIVPSKEVCYQMMAASIITENNIDYTNEKVTD